MGSYNAALGTMKNPDRVMAAPLAASDLGLNPSIASNYALLLCLPRTYDDWGTNPDALSRQNNGNSAIISLVCAEEKPKSDDKRKPEAITTFLYAGFDLADEYCEIFFEDADESQRRRQYGRALWNDFGTAVSTILGLANAGEDFVTGTAAAVGLGDSAWRNYDDAFVVGPDLSNVYGLVNAEQELMRTNIRTQEARKPESFAQARRDIRNYARHCTHLGMRSLLSRAASQQQFNTEEEIDGALQPAQEPTPPTAPAGSTEGVVTSQPTG